MRKRATSCGLWQARQKREVAPIYKTLTIGMRDHYVAVLQAGLNISLPGETPLAVDGIFWTQTQGRVKKFQREKQLETDGASSDR